MKTIIPIKLITDLNPDGTARSSLLQYKISIDGAIEEKFYTMTVDAGIDLGNFNPILANAAAHAEQGEGITESAFITGGGVMKKISPLILAFLLLASPGWAAWDATKPTDNDVRKNAPAQIRANWSAIATGTDAALCTNNAKMCAGAAVADDKLAQITSAAKVHGSALTGLSSIPSSANGQIPIANGGTGASTATAATNAILPAQATNSGKALITDASNASWGYPSSLTVASAATGDMLYYNGTIFTRLAAGTSGYYLKAAGAAAPVWTQPNVANGPVVLDGSAKLPAVDGSALTGISTAGVEVLTAGSSWTAPPGITKVLVTTVGAGGGGAGSQWQTNYGGGGGAGAFFVDMVVTTVPGSSYSYSIGAAGSGGAANVDGTDGGDTTFNTLTVKGGKKGLAAGNGGAGGIGYTAATAPTAGTVYYFDGKTGATQAGGYGGGGAGSPWGAGGNGGTQNTGAGAAGTAATGYGAGGGGGAQTSGSLGIGAAGSPGLIILRY
jgi:hypothetical protein